MAKTPINHRKTWTPAQVRQLKELAKGNTPTRVIGMKLGRSEEAIRSKAADLDLSLRRLNQSPYNRRGAK